MLVAGASALRCPSRHDAARGQNDELENLHLSAERSAIEVVLIGNGDDQQVMFVHWGHVQGAAVVVDEISRSTLAPETDWPSKNAPSEGLVQ